MEILPRSLSKKKKNISEVPKSMTKRLVHGLFLNYERKKYISGLPFSFVRDDHYTPAPNKGDEYISRIFAEPIRAGFVVEM
jgi:hypothetical protein